MDFLQVDQSKVSPDILRFALHCRQLAGGAAMPKRRDFAPRDVPWLFGCVTAIDVIDGGRDYRFSYCGDFWRVVVDCDMLGWRLSEAESCNRLTCVRFNYDSAVCARSPRYRFGRWTWPNGLSIRYERLLTPFADDNGKVTMLVLVARPEKPLSELFALPRNGLPRIDLEATAPDMSLAA
jgi:hypothetical protein